MLSPPPVKKSQKEKDKGKKNDDNDDVDDDAPNPPAKPPRKNKGGRPTIAETQKRAALQQLHDDTAAAGDKVKTAIEIAALDVITQLQQVSAATAAIKPVARSTTQPAPPPPPPAMSRDEILRQDEDRRSREEERKANEEERRAQERRDHEDRLHINNVRQAELMKSILGHSHEWRMKEQAQQGDFMLRSARTSGAVECPPPTAVATKSNLKLLKGVQYCVEWLKNHGFKSRIKEGALSSVDIIAIGIECLEEPQELMAAIAGTEDKAKRINLLIDAFDDQDED